jgi:hypothetical protein
MPRYPLTESTAKILKSIIGPKLTWFHFSDGDIHIHLKDHDPA